MTYEEFVKREDIKREERRIKLTRKGNQAYNEGLWKAVRWNPFNWWVYMVYRRA